ncbi:hypothetical protein B0G80_0707 [Paraburkholderia sp. BL6669N2]|nr:hypothetical protein B0G80_0707 [Paraburkholderia sp. BL6669N2]
MREQKGEAINSSGGAFQSTGKLRQASREPRNVNDWYSNAALSLSAIIGPERSSVSSCLKRPIQPGQFDAGIAGGELPVNPGLKLIALNLPRADLAAHRVDIVDAPSRHCLIITLSSISAMFSQLPCLGV